jgi:hypothetical protein
VGAGASRLRRNGGLTRGRLTRAMTPAGSDDRVRPGLSVADLERWVDNGATWRALEVTDQRAVVELCTCYGEPVDLLSGDDAELVAYVRDHGLRSE